VKKWDRKIGCPHLYWSLRVVNNFVQQRTVRYWCIWREGNARGAWGKLK